MSTHTLPSPPSATEGYPGLISAVTALLRPPTLVAYVNGNVAYTFTPDLSAAEATTFADIVAAFRSRDVDLTPEEYALLKPQLATGRAFVALSPHEPGYVD